MKVNQRTTSWMSFKKLLITALVCSALVAPAAKEFTPATHWRGFNLLEMFIKYGSAAPKEFQEADFQMMHDWGFNFARLPMDYRFWIKDGDWDQFDESALAIIDRAIAFGRKYGIHVCICMHRAPGYTVARPAEKTNLFTDAEPLRVAAKHWAMFARRYRGIPNEALSFNLFNEPARVTPAAYEKVAKALIAAIRAEDPERFILADGLSWGNIPMKAFVGIPNVGQSTRGYSPGSVSHYLAPWAGAPSNPPVWPPVENGPKGPFTGVAKAEMRVPFVVSNLPPCRVCLSYRRVSDEVNVAFTADGREVANATLRPTANDPAWSNVKYFPRWKISQGTYNGVTEVTLPQGAQNLTIQLAKGDWAMPKALDVVALDGTAKAKLVFAEAWQRPEHFVRRFAGFGADEVFVACDVPAQKRSAHPGRAYLARHQLAAWDAVRAQGEFVMAGEFGVWKKTPHTITLAFLEDYLALWKERKMGWALWNLRGEFGILDSNREDVQYEDYKGHKLDRKMLDLLLKY